jgi:nucleoside-triphosphatase THEP1
MIVIGISGKLGVGKSTIARHIVSKLDNWQIASFADLLKQEAAEQFGLDVRLAYTEQGKASIISLPDGSRKTLRELLQWYGTDVVRAKDRDYWVRSMTQHLDRVRSKVAGMIIDDVRFPNEANLVLRRQGFLVRIDPYPGYALASDHASETALDGYKGFRLKLRPNFGEECLRKAADAIIVAERMYSNS